MSRTLTLPLPDGRTLEVVEEGDERGTLLIFHHGSPGAAVPFEPFDRAAAERGIRLVTLSRAGFGGSTRCPGRSVADAAADAAALADHLGAERFVTIGWSGGGPHALACAALLPERVTAAATIAGVAPYDAPGLEWTAGMGESNRIEYPLAARDPEELLRWMRPQVEALAVVEPDHIVSELRTRDLRASTRRRSTARSASSWLRPSIGRSATGRGAGTTTTSPSFGPWGFELSSIGVPVSIWQGRQDLMVPFAHGEWLVEHVPTARPRLRPEHGHLSLAVGSIGEILDDLLEAAASSGPLH